MWLSHRLSKTQIPCLRFISPTLQPCVSFQFSRFPDKAKYVDPPCHPHPKQALGTVWGEGNVVLTSILGFQHTCFHKSCYRNATFHVPWSTQSSDHHWPKGQSAVQVLVPGISLAHSIIQFSLVGSRPPEIVSPRPPWLLLICFSYLTWLVVSRINDGYCYQSPLPQ